MPQMPKTAHAVFAIVRRARVGLALIVLLSGCALSAEQSLNAVAPTTIAPVTIAAASTSTSSLASVPSEAPQIVLSASTSTSPIPSGAAVSTTVLDRAPAAGPGPTTLVNSVVASVLAGPSVSTATTTSTAASVFTATTTSTAASVLSFAHDASLDATCIAGQWTIGSGALTRYLGEVAPRGGTGNVADGTISMVVGPDLALRVRGLFTVTVNVGGNSRYLYDVTVDQSVRLRPRPDNLTEAAVVPTGGGAAPVRITGGRSRGPAPEGVFALEANFSTFFVGTVGITCTTDRLVVEGAKGSGAPGSYHLEFSRVAR